jgi:hypothetical protein
VRGRHFIFALSALIPVTASTPDARPTNEPRSSAASGRASPKTRAKPVFERRLAMKSKTPEAGAFAGGESAGDKAEAWLALGGWAADSRSVSAIASTTSGLTMLFIVKGTSFPPDVDGCFTRETQVGTSAEIVDAAPLGYNRLHGPSRYEGQSLVVAAVLSSSSLCPSADGVLIPEWKAHCGELLRRVRSRPKDWQYQ